jgi:hypothetical protein
VNYLDPEHIARLAPDPEQPCDAISLRDQCRRQARTIADLQRKLRMVPWIALVLGIAVGLGFGTAPQNNTCQPQHSPIPSSR